MVVALVFLTLIPPAFFGERRQSASWANKTIPIHEIAAAAGLVLLPPLAIGLARLGIGVFAARYLVFSVAGFSLLISYAAARLANDSFAVGLGLALIVLGGVGVRFILLRQNFQAMHSWVQSTIASLDKASQGGMPVVISNPITYLQMDHYASFDGAARFTYLASPERSREILGQDTSDRALWALRDWVAPRLTDYDSFVRKSKHFLVFSNEAWLIPALVEEGASIKLREGNLFEVDLGPMNKSNPLK
jgi:hypothetical protein